MRHVTQSEINKIRFNMIMHASHVNIVNTRCTNCVRRRGKLNSRESRQSESDSARLSTQPRDENFPNTKYILVYLI